MANLDQIEQMFKKYMQPMNEIIKVMNDKMANIKEALHEIKEEAKSNKEKFNNLEENVTDLQKQVEFLKSEFIKKNLIVFGLPEKHDEKLPHVVIDFFQKQLGITDISIWEIVDAKRIGKKGNHDRGIKIELTTKTRKMQVLGLTYLLRGKNYRVQPEYTKKVMEDRKALKPFLIEAREKGLKAHLVYNKLKIDDYSFTIEEILTEKSNKIEEPNKHQVEKHQILPENLTLSEDSTEEEEENNLFSTPSNSLTLFKPKNKQQITTNGLEKGAVPKRKNISPLSLSNQKLREEGPKVKHKQQKIDQLFREKENKTLIQ